MEIQTSSSQILVNLGWSEFRGLFVIKCWHVHGMDPVWILLKLILWWGLGFTYQHLRLTKCSWEKQGRKWWKQDWRWGRRQAREKFQMIAESQIPQDTLDHKLHLRFVPLWSKEWTIKLPHKSVPSYRFSQECSASNTLLLLYTENKVGFGREGPRESEYPRGCALHVAITNLPCLHLSCKVWFSMFFWVKEFNCEAEFTASLRMHLEPVHFHRNFH